MKLSLLIGLCVFFFLVACSSDTEPTYVASPPLVLAIGLDVSGTFSEYPPVTLEFFKSLSAIAQKSDRKTTLAVLPIGNTSDQYYLRLHMQPPLPIDNNQPLSVRARQKQIYDAKTEVQKKAVDMFLNQLEEKVLQLKNQQATDLNGFFTKTNILLSEASFQNAEKAVLVISDGLHDANGSQTLSCHFPPEIQMFLVGWKNKDFCEGSVQQVESPEGFLEIITDHF